MKLAIVGSRSIDDYEVVSQEIAQIEGVNEIISGGARGVDSLARRYSQEYHLPLKEFIPDWKHFGRSAGMIRNRDIVNECDSLIAFWDGESVGTAESIKLAQRQGKLIKIVHIRRSGIL